MLKRLFKPTYVVVSSIPMDDNELAGAFALHPADKRFQAWMQVLDEVESEAVKAAQATVANPALSASCNGGAEHIAILRNRILALREKGYGKSESNRN